MEWLTEKKSHLTHDLIQRESSPEQDAHLAVLRKDFIPRSQSRSASDDGSLLAVARHHEADSTLPLSIVENHVERR